MDTPLCPPRNTQCFLVALRYPRGNSALIPRGIGLRTQFFMHSIPEDLGLHCDWEMYQEIRARNHVSRYPLCL